MASTTVTLSSVAALLLIAALALPASASPASPSSVRWVAMPEEHHATLAGYNPPEGMDESDLQSVRVPRSLSALSQGAVELAESDMAEPLLRQPRRAPQLESEQPSRQWMVSSLANLNRRRRSANLADQLKGIRGLYEMYEPADSAVFRAPRAAPAAWELPVEPAPLLCDCGTDHGAAAARIARGTPKDKLAEDESCYKPASPGAVSEGKLEGAVVSDGVDLPDELEISTDVIEGVADDECHANFGDVLPNPKAPKQESTNKVVESVDELDVHPCEDFTTDNDENLPEPELTQEAAESKPCKAEPKKAN